MATNIIDMLNGIISIYMLLIIIRLVMSWFTTQHENDPRNFLVKICDPYLNYFKRFNLNLGNADFSPILAITFLVIAGNILTQLSIYGNITVGIILAVIISSIWYALSSLLTLIIILIIVRLIMLLTTTNTFSPFTNGLDSILMPIASKATAIFVKNAATGYQINLIILGVFLIAIKILGSYGVTFLSNFLPTLPF